MLCPSMPWHYIDCLSCHATSFHAVAYHVITCRVMPYQDHDMSCQIMLDHIISSYVTPSHTSAILPPCCYLAGIWSLRAEDQNDLSVATTNTYNPGKPIDLLHRLGSSTFKSPYKSSRDRMTKSRGTSIPKPLQATNW